MYCMNNAHYTIYTIDYHNVIRSKKSAWQVYLYVKNISMFKFHVPDSIVTTRALNTNYLTFSFCNYSFGLLCSSYNKIDKAMVVHRFIFI